MQSKFTEGSVSRHLLTMMFASWVALASNMLLSLADMYFLSRLGDVDVLAAVGFSGSIVMFPNAVGIGFSIAISVLVSQALSRSGRDKASSLFSSILVIAFALALLVVAIFLFLLPYLLSILGAQGRVHALAMDYLSLTLLSAPLSVLLMAFASGLRSVSMAKMSMWVSLVSSVVNIILDPILIEVMGFGIVGAAWATIIARVVAVAIGLWVLIAQLGFVQKVDLSGLWQTFLQAKGIAAPAVISNLFTPIGGLIVVSVVSSYGSEAMAGLAVVGSLTPILLSVFFSLTGAAGPMVGQNMGANMPDRIASIFRQGVIILASYTLLIWCLFMLAYPVIIEAYSLTGLAVELLWLYCFVQVPLSVGLGFLALSNGIYNNLGKPRWSMWLNASRSSVATFILCHLGAYFFGVYGAVMASTISFVLYGVSAVFLARYLFKSKYPETRFLF